MGKQISFILLGTGLFACNSDKGVTVFNSPPVAEITSHSDGDTVYEGYAVSFVAALSDNNHNNADLIARWTANGEELCPYTPPDENGDSTCTIAIQIDQTKIKIEVKDPGNKTGDSEVTLDIVPTEAPDATISTPTANGIYYSDRLITFSGVATDAEDSPQDLTITWESSVDGPLAITSNINQDGELEGVANLSEGEHYITLSVEDTTEKTTTDSVVINVGGSNTPPSCGITTPVDGSQFSRGEIIEFQGLATDTNTPANLLDVQWISDQQGALTQSIPDNSGVVSFTTGDLDSSLHQITLQVTDDLGETCTESIQVTVGTPPDITIVSPTNGALYNDGELVQFSGITIDPNNNNPSLVVEWKSDISGTLDNPIPDSSGNVGFVTSNLDVGTHVIELQATTTTGYTTSESIGLIINGLPTQPLVSLSPDPTYSSNDLTAVVSNATDPEGDSISYTYVWYKDGVQTNHTANTVPAADLNKNENWLVEVTPVDAHGGIGPMGQGSITITNTAPIINGVTLSPSSIGANDVVTCNVNWTDPDETPALSYIWTLDGATVGTANTIDLSGLGTAPGATLQCAATATDSDNATDTGSISQVISNSLPVVTSLTTTPTTVYTNDTLIATVTTLDTDGQTVTVTYDWYVDGVSVQNGTDNTLSGTTYFDKNQVVQVIVTPNDGVDDGSPSPSANVTIANTDPVIDTISMTPNSNLRNGDGVSCAATAIDEDNETPTITYEWLVNGTAIATTATTTLTTAVRGDTVECQATATDSDNATNTSSVSAQIENTPPTLSSASLSPSSPTSQDSITCTPVGGNDVDGDTLSYSYQWEINGSVATETSDTLGAGITPGSVVTCLVTPTDGFDNGNTVQQSTSISNAPPEVTNVTLSPTTIYTDDIVTATATGTDVDGQSVTFTYDWYVDGTSVQNGTANTLDGTTHFSKHQSIHVIVTPSDGIDTGTAMQSTSVSVSNSAPETPVVSFNPADPEPGVDNLTCQVDYLFDADGDPITYDFVWTIEGTTYTGTPLTTNQTDDTIAGTETTNNENWTCTLTVTDDDGASASSATTPILVGCEPDTGTKPSCAAEDCAEILFDGYSTGNGNYWIDPQGNGNAFEVYCLMDTTYSNGGWTMIMVASDDGQDSWTYDNANYFTTNTTTFGDLQNMNMDLKSRALHEVGMTDVLFFHEPSGTWASYESISSGVNGYDAFAQSHSEATCYNHGDGYAMTAGTLTTSGQLCSTELFINAADRDGGTCGNGDGDDALGPSWSVSNSSCPFDDPGTIGSLGPTPMYPAEEGDNQGAGNPLGFGWAIGGNTGTAGTGENYIQVFVRRSPTDNDNDGIRDWLDCDDNDPNIGIIDNDGDGYSACFDDCDDNDATMNHDDLDGDGYSSCDGDCDDNDIDMNLDDLDGDGYSSCDGDCNENDPTIHPLAGDSVGDTVDTDCDSLNCNATTYGDVYFVICNSVTNWTSAQAACLAAGHDGLATIADADEDAYITSQRNGISMAHWIGYNDRTTEGTFGWITGQPYTYTNWSINEPSNSGNEDCAAINPYNAPSVSANKWNDAKCHKTISGGNNTGFICESR